MHSGSGKGRERGGGGVGGKLGNKMRDSKFNFFQIHFADKYSNSSCTSQVLDTLQQLLKVFLKANL